MPDGTGYDRSRGKGSGSGPLPDHVTMPLLSLVTNQAMEDDYRDAATRAERASGTASGTANGEHEAAENPRVRRAGPRAAVVLAVLGLMIAVAAVQTSKEAPAAADGREALIAEIGQRRENVARQLRAEGELEQDNERLKQQGAGLSEEVSRLRARNQSVSAANGYSPVRGPGLNITVEDPEGGVASQAVRDEDLAILIDGLWRAGAEAISIDKRRLTPMSQIRNSGGVIRVGSQSVSPPYSIAVIGDPDTLQANLVEADHGAAWYSLVSALGFGFSVETADEVRLPGAAREPLRHATEQRKAD